MGNLSGASWLKVFIMGVVAVLLMSLFPRDSKALNALLLGESKVEKQHICLVCHFEQWTHRFTM